ncbi:MAG: endonuclease III domain-containing protein [Methyloligellaceae bacterium]
MVMAILGGRTYRAISKSAFHALLDRFGGWEAVRDAAVEDVGEVIAPVTYGQEKARRLQAALARVTVLRGRLELYFLRDWPVDSALDWLERLPGVGRKVSTATLNFSMLRKKALVIDTHHLRVLRRLGLVRPRASLEEAYRRVMPLLPQDWTAEALGDHHHLMTSLGERICRHRAPKCGACPLREICPAWRSPEAARSLHERRRGVVSM